MKIQRIQSFQVKMNFEDQSLDDIINDCQAALDRATQSISSRRKKLVRTPLPSTSLLSDNPPLPSTSLLPDNPPLLDIPPSDYSHRDIDEPPVIKTIEQRAAERMQTQSNSAGTSREVNSSYRSSSPARSHSRSHIDSKQENSSYRSSRYHSRYYEPPREVNSSFRNSNQSRSRSSNRSINPRERHRREGGHSRPRSRSPLITRRNIGKGIRKAESQSSNMQERRVIQESEPQTIEEYFQWRKQYQGVSVPPGFLEDECEFTRNMDLDELEELENAYYNWYRRTQLPIPSSRCKIFEARERNHLRYWAEFAEDEIPTKMPILTLKEAENLIKPNGKLRTTDLSVNQHRVKIKYMGDELDKPFLDIIIQNIKKYRICSFDTEETLEKDAPPLPKVFQKSYLQRNQVGPLHSTFPIPSEGIQREPRLTTIIGDFEGRVYIFREIGQLPEDVKSLFRDFRITKIQSNVLADVHQFNLAGIPVVGWADTQLIYKAFINPQAKRIGTDQQAIDLGFDSLP